MAKKLGILALVVCMLLAVAVVANAAEANYLDATGDLSGKGTCADSPYRNEKSWHFYETLAPSTTKCDKDGNLDEDGEYTLGYHRWNNSVGITPADKAVAFKVSDVKTTYPMSYVLNTIKAGKDGWKLFQAEQHSYGTAVAAIYRRTCVYCKATEEVIVPVTHNWKLTDDKANDDDKLEIKCEEDTELTKGEIVECTVCKEKITTNDGDNKVVIKAPGHDWQVIDRVSSCTVPGGKGAVCARCGKTSADEVGEGFEYTGKDKWQDYDDGAVLGHQWAVSYYTTAAGKLEKPADNSKKILNLTGTKMYFGDPENAPTNLITVDPKCVGADTEITGIVYKCTRPGCDGHSDQGHAPEGAKYPTGTQSIGKDGLILTAAFPTATVHTAASMNVDESDYVKPTCVMTGYYYKTCPFCGLKVVTKVESVSEPVGHKFAKDTEVKPIHKAGTNGKDSVHTRECTVCGALVEEACNGITPVPANCENGGGAIVNCTICGFKQNWLDPDGKKLDADALEENNAKQHYGYFLNGETTTDEAKLGKWTTKKEKVATSCDKTGLIEYVCNVCGETIKTVQVAGKHDLVLSSTQLKDCTQDWVEVWVCSRENCPGVSVKAGLSTSGTTEGKGDYTATITTVNKKAAERRVYKAHKTHTTDKNDSTKIEVVKEANCGVAGEGYLLCTICGQRAEKYDIPATGKHEYTAAGTKVDATCTEPARVGQICKVCGQVKPGTTATDVENSEKLGHNYANPTYYKTKDAAQTGKAVDQIDQPATCEMGYWTRTVCTRCGDVKTEEHKKGEHDFAAATHLAADCDHNDRQAKVCKVCGFEELVLDNYLEAGGEGIADPALKATGHKWDTAKLVEDPDATGKNTKHQKICSVCGAKVTEACEYETDKEQTKKATCANVAVTVEVCKVCKNAVVTYGTALDPNNHDYKQVALEGEAPTCTEKGFVREECPDCGAIGKTIEVDPLGHAWARKDADWTTGLVITTAPTCVKDGVGHRECSICGFKTEDIVIGKYDGANTAYGHTWTRADYVWSADQLIVDVAPTCTVDGKGHYVCADCGYVFETGIPHYDGANTPYGHTWTRADYVWSIDQLKISVEPTCVKDGEGYYECTDCGYKMTGVAVPHYDGANTPYGHIWAREPWPAGLQQHEDGTYYYECPDCHYIQEAE